MNTFAPFVLSPLLPFSLDQHSPEAALDDSGVGVYGQGTVTFGNKLDATVGARFDYENKKANLNTFLRAAHFSRRRSSTPRSRSRTSRRSLRSAITSASTP